MRTILTSVKGLRIPNVEVLFTDYLNIGQAIRQRQQELLSKSTVPENLSARLMDEFDEKPIRQAYFRIRGRSYFLDFFFKKRMLAIEIDGSSHNLRKETDRRRDADFRSIGIKTIRVKNKDVMSGKLYEKIFKRLYR